MPTHPAIGYGYIQADSKNQIKAGNTYAIKTFHEKPNIKRATKYLKQGNMFWNLGMFVGKTTTFLREYKACSPKMYETVSNFYKTKQNYEKATSLSIDYAVMEKSKNIFVVPCDFEWNDVGNLETFLSIQKKHSTKTDQQIINIDSKNNIAKTSKKLVAFVGIDDLCVIEDDNVILVVKRNDVEKVKEIQTKLRQNKYVKENV